jgi:hypothetical protein
MRKGRGGLVILRSGGNVVRLKSLLLFLIVFALAAAASAQTKISGSQRCAKPDQELAIQVGDRLNHSFVLTQAKCTWTKPMEFAGVLDKEGIDTDFAEISGNTSRARGYEVDTLANGDKVSFRYEATLTLKDGVAQSGEPRWTLFGGTGKLKGIKGKGSCKLTSAAADGSSTWDCEGEYELPK